ncbi:hypothetical protein QW180_12185 [Vibrio sinaloensis]|nr:hypothetical protein [Vibrio sinaloensis]
MTGKMIMTNTLYNKHIISIPELSREELELIVKTAGELKAEPRPELIKKTKLWPVVSLSHQPVLVCHLKRLSNVSVAM